jgi:2-keto-myo-inositol isomerase
MQGRYALFRATTAQGGNGERQANVQIAIKVIRPLLQDAGMVGLVERPGFARSSLCSKTELVEIIQSVGGTDCFRIVPDTFHHVLVDGGPLFADQTGIVHISGVVDPVLTLAQVEDEHRVLVDDQDRLGNAEHILALIAARYD